ncbi:Hypothetical predicted protein [Xyrichtys novacula]|uniref:Uncharacterized protein n=1 Tax=Xyrichtys novacula TaxID=13765 RepID=A0AAV1ESU0_XYRNO|nr:Hypothetical predicted protein [Xyrichtys novacula]
MFAFYVSGQPVLPNNPRPRLHVTQKRRLENGLTDTGTSLFGSFVLLCDLFTVTASTCWFEVMMLNYSETRKKQNQTDAVWSLKEQRQNKVMSISTRIQLFTLRSDEYVS